MYYEHLAEQYVDENKEEHSVKCFQTHSCSWRLLFYFWRKCSLYWQKKDTNIKVNVSISKFIADMHVEIWWSRKICFFFYTNVFLICTITQFSVSRYPCRPSSAHNTLSHWVQTAPHIISYSKFPVETVCSTFVIYRRLKTLEAGEIIKQKIRKLIKFDHLFHHNVSISSSNSPLVGTPCKFISCNSHVLHTTFHAFSSHQSTSTAV